MIEHPTVRDQMAMAALTGLLANSEAVHAQQEPTSSYLSTNPRAAAYFAQKAYQVSDAMMAQRALLSPRKEGSD